MVEQSSPEKRSQLRRNLAIILAVLIGIAIGFVVYYFAFGPPEEGFRDRFEILPREDHNVHAIEAYGTLAVAIISVVIAFLIWLSVSATWDDVKATLKEVQSHEHAIQVSSLQTIAVEIIRLGRWMADHPEYRKELERPPDEHSDTGQAVATVHADFLDAVMVQKGFNPPDFVESWKTWFRDRREEWPQLDKYVKSHGDWYPDDDFDGTEPPQKGQ